MTPFGCGKGWTGSGLVRGLRRGRAAREEKEEEVEEEEDEEEEEDVGYLLTFRNLLLIKRDT